MTSRVSLSRRAAKTLLHWTRPTKDSANPAELERARSEVESVLSPRTKKPMRREREKAKQSKRAAKNEETAAIRAAVVERAGGKCEAGCTADVSAETGHMDHFFSRRHGQSVETCWFLCPACDHQKTNNQPRRRFWLWLFREHCRRRGYGAEIARVQKMLDVEDLSRASAEAGKGAGR